jgi:CubicO group peptidase (beta-lactamase class C family)
MARWQTARRPLTVGLMTTLVAHLRDVQETLDALARRHRVPGATLAIAAGDELVDFATGTLNVNTGVEATTDSIFQIGSNTKLFTTTLVMQLVDEGAVDLDAPVRRYLTGFSLNDPSAAREITVRQLLTHTSGIQGDYFDGFGRGDDAIERYVDSLSGIDLVHRPGQMWSYCNSGFVVAGRLAEVLRGAPYHQLLKDRICAPLGLRRTTVLVSEMLRHRSAVGHVPGPDGQPMVPPTVVMEYAQAPAGSMTTATAAELVRFVQMHLDDGAAPNGTQVLSADSVRAMQEVQATLPPTSSVPLTQGLGWLMHEWGGKKVIGHGGGTIGQLSFLEAIPEDGLVVALLTNGMSGGLLWRDLARWLFDELAGVQPALAPKVPANPPALNLERYAGTYERLGLRNTVTLEGGELVLRAEPTGAVAELQQGQPPAPPVHLRPIDRERFGAKVNGVDTVLVFSEFERGRPGYLFGGRAARRVGGRRPPSTTKSAGATRRSATPAKRSATAKRGGRRARAKA